MSHQSSENPNATNSLQGRSGEQGRSRKHDSEDECDYAGEQSKIIHHFFHALRCA